MQQMLTLASPSWSPVQSKARIGGKEAQHEACEAQEQQPANLQVGRGWWVRMDAETVGGDHLLL